MEDGPVRLTISTRYSQRTVVEYTEVEGAGNTHVALPADHLVAVVLASQGLQTRLDDTTTETEDEM